MSTETLQKEIVMTIYSSQGKNQNRISIKAGLLWEEGKKIVKSNGYNIDGMRAIESIRKGVLEHPKAIMPNEDFNLHLYPVKSKGGAKVSTPIIRKEITEKIKRHIVGHGEKAKKFFSKDISYANKTTEDLSSLLTKWEKKNGDAPEVEIPQPRKKSVKAIVKTELGEIKDTISSVVESLATYATANTPEMTIKTAIELLKGVTEHENQVLVEEAVTKLEKALVKKPTLSEQELLKEEHQSLGAGLSGIVLY